MTFFHVSTSFERSCTKKWYGIFGTGKFVAKAKKNCKGTSGTICTIFYMSDCLAKGRSKRILFKEKYILIHILLLCISVMLTKM